MDREPELKIIRRAFAKQVMAGCGIRNPRVEAAFAMAREDFLGPGPWQIVRWGGGYRATPECQCRRDAARGCMARPAKGGGRLILPLTADGFPTRDVRRGVVFRIERCGPEFFARRISGVAIFPCEGGRDEASLWPSTRAAPSA
jgi:hypothetical protein